MVYISIVQSVFETNRNGQASTSKNSLCEWNFFQWRIASITGFPTEILVLIARPVTAKTSRNVKRYVYTQSQQICLCDEVALQLWLLNALQPVTTTTHAYWKLGFNQA